MSAKDIVRKRTPHSNSGVLQATGTAPDFARAKAMPKDRQLTMPTDSAPDKGQTERPVKETWGAAQRQGGRKGASTEGGGAKE